MMDERRNGVLVLGLGNDILTDDAVGLAVARGVGQSISAVDGVTVLETVEMGVGLLDYLTGYDSVVLVDAIQTGRASAGTVHEMEVGELRLVPGVSPHFVGVGEVLALGRVLGLAMPRRVEIVAVEVEDPLTLGTRMTPLVEAAVPLVTERVLARARWLAGCGRGEVKEDERVAEV
jgi:hydrogenase maturation protease